MTKRKSLIVDVGFYFTMLLVVFALVDFSILKILVLGVLSVFGALAGYIAWRIFRKKEDKK